jgi:pimeloyl-ACP methyl ester carboxylesterase
VLVDTSPAAEGLIDENIPDFDEVAGRESYAAYTLHCAFLAVHGTLGPSNSEFIDCTATLPSDTPAAFRKIWPQFFTADYFSDKVSLMSSLYTHRYDSADHHRLGSIPLVVLSAEHEWIDNTPAGIRFTQAFSKYWFAQHEALARLSSRGVHRIIKGSGHQIQLEQPQAVIDAVDEVLRQLHAGAKSRGRGAAGMAGQSCGTRRLRSSRSLSRLRPPRSRLPSRVSSSARGLDAMRAQNCGE